MPFRFDNSSEFLPPAGEAAAADSSTLHFTQAADDLFVLSDSVVNFEDVIQQPLPSQPKHVGLTGSADSVSS